jgi:hypothetical protein
LGFIIIYYSKSAVWKNLEYIYYLY